MLDDLANLDPLLLIKNNTLILQLHMCQWNLNKKSIGILIFVFSLNRLNWYKYNMYNKISLELYYNCRWSGWKYVVEDGRLKRRSQGFGYSSNNFYWIVAWCLDSGITTNFYWNLKCRFHKTLLPIGNSYKYIFNYITPNNKW